jgi:hypothetical protein
MGGRCDLAEAKGHAEVHRAKVGAEGKVLELFVLLGWEGGRESKFDRLGLRT